MCPPSLPTAPPPFTLAAAAFVLTQTGILRKSWVWKHFQLSPTVTATAWCAVPSCPSSKREVPRKGSNTTGLSDHLRDNHSITKDKPVPAPDVRALFAAQAKAEAIPACSDAFRLTMNRHIAQLFIANCLPFNVAVCPQFVQMLHYASRRSYIPPARTAVTQSCDQLYQSMIDLLLLDIRETTISITTDAACRTGLPPCTWRVSFR